MKFEIHNGDCLEVMARLIDEGMKVNAVICDPPYGTTACSWDSVIPFDAMWQRLKKLTYKNSPIVLFGSQLFTSALVMSNPKMFRYEWIWKKNIPTGHLDCNRKPLKTHENICVFSEDSNLYNPQMLTGETHSRGANKYQSTQVYGNFSKRFVTHSDEYYPRSIIKFNKDGYKHSTQKPVNLMRYLVRTYSNEGDAILDFTCGSGSTGVACAIENRDFIGIELIENYCDVSRARITRATGKYAEIPRKTNDKELPLFTL